MEMGHIIQIQANSTVLSVCDQYTQRLLLSISFAHYLFTYLKPIFTKYPTRKLNLLLVISSRKLMHSNFKVVSCISSVAIVIAI